MALRFLPAPKNLLTHLYHLYTPHPPKAEMFSEIREGSLPNVAFMPLFMPLEAFVQKEALGCVLDRFHEVSITKQSGRASEGKGGAFLCILEG